MKKDQGWIKVYRQVTSSSIWDTDEPYDKRSAWIDLLLSVNHEDRDIIIGNDTLKVLKGQRYTSVRKLSEHWNWSKNRTLAFLRQLESLKMITRDGTRSGTLITIVKYDDFQNGRDTKRDTNRDTKRT